MTIILAFNGRAHLIVSQELYKYDRLDRDIAVLS